MKAAAPRIYVLLGGFVGPDGYLDSPGMLAFEAVIAHRFPAAKCQVFDWSRYLGAAADIISLPRDAKVIVIGYSGGGSRATWLANGVRGRTIDLMICYDPSPAWQMMHIGDNVKRAVCYFNETPWFFGLGGGMLVGPNVEKVTIREEHALVQSDGKLHQRSIDEINRVLTA